MRWSDAAVRAVDLIIAAAAATGAWLLLEARAVLAATPSPSPVPGGDPRSAGQGPGLVGDPLFAIGVVIAVGVVALVGTLAYVRITGGPARR